MTTATKAAYVRSASQRPDKTGHHCHWPGCDKAVPPAMWGCKAHWFKLPLRLRSRIWVTYSPGQEISKTPSAEYLSVARDVQDWIAAQGTEAGTAETQGGSVHDGPVGNADAPKDEA